jgi:penicillin-binding protein 1A
MSSMLSDVITSGTATAARSGGFTRPAAGKTGTTDNYQDAWFIGYTPHLATGVWFGVDTPAPIMNRGFAAVVAVPAWAEFMKQATAHDAADGFSPPPDVEKVTVCRVSGLRATEWCRDEPAGGVYDEYFPIGRAPTDSCDIHALPPLNVSDGHIESVVGLDGRVTWVSRQ